ncbi:hypothetical protein BRADI_3g27720v3 [Brachypodium distachyon]|uniref:Uncharacterized protein n=1 Tax=Brachypodium distachyon TaxID=15368 RepID=A0A2K2CZK6_BRADI|nr:hypothetical protein BRADI_3g27720v3 [Brachypodium distachyon]
MGFVSFAGRVLFAAAFLLSAYQEFSEFGSDGGTAAKALSPKINIFVENVSSRTGIVVPHIELKHVIAVAIALKGIGGLLFILSSSFGASLLVNSQLCVGYLIIHSTLSFTASVQGKQFCQNVGKSYNSQLSLGL